MTLIALLSARDGARERLADGRTGPLIGLGGQPLVEFQARAAINAGADRILILTDIATPDLGQLIDRLGATTGVQAALAQDMVTLSRSLTPGDRLLLVAENLVVPVDALDALAGGAAPALLTVPDVPATDAFERIDAETRWAGALLLSGDAVLATLDMLGDWDLPLTLLRRAVQADARRVALTPELVMDGHLTIVQDAESAHLALRARTERDREDANAQRGPIGRLLAPVSRLIVQELVRREVEPGWLRGVALAVAALGLALAVAGLAALALIVMLGAAGLDDLARQNARITLRDDGADWRDWLVSGGGLALLAILGWRLADGEPLALTGAWMPVLLVGLLAWRHAHVPESSLWRGWTAMTIPVALIVMLIGFLTSLAAPALAFLGTAATVMTALHMLFDARAKV